MENRRAALARVGEEQHDHERLADALADPEVVDAVHERLAEEE